MTEQATLGSFDFCHLIALSKSRHQQDAIEPLAKAGGIETDKVACHTLGV
jgi:hypothetical protein